MSYILTVVDMQEEFLTNSQKRVKMACRNAVSKAIKDKASIIVLEYEECGPTIALVANLTKSYNKSYYMEKGTDDGSAEVLEVINNRRLKKELIKVVGVNTNACVLATVRGLMYKLPKSTIEVLANACDSSYEAGHWDGLEFMEDWNNPKVKVIK